MEYYSALAKRRRLEKQAVVAAPSLQTQKSSRLLWADDAKFKCDEPSSSITTTHEDKNDSSKERTDTRNRRGKKRVSISGEVEIRTISPRKSPRLSSAAAKSNAKIETEIDDSDEYDSDEAEELGNYIYKNSRTAQRFRDEETKLASAPLSKTLRKSLLSADVKSDDTEVKQQTIKYPIGTRMAKEFFIEDRKVTELCYGSITGYNSDDNSYSVLYDDGDKEDISEVEMDAYIKNATSEEEEEAPKRIGTRLDDATKLGALLSATTTKSSNDGIKKRFNIDRRDNKRNLSEEAVAPTTSRKSSRQLTASAKSGVPSSEEIGAVTIATRRVVRRNGRARALCSTAGCNSLAVKLGVCIRHGAKQRSCSYKGCNNNAIKSGVCCRHGAKRKPCSYEGCCNQSLTRGVCTRHGAKRYTCSHKGCNNHAQSKGECYRHGAERKLCSHEGCSNISVKLGVCIRHGAQTKKCSHEGCTNNSKRNGVCRRHGAPRKRCSYKGCNNGAVNSGVCTRHGAKKKRTCSHEGCNLQAKLKGVCYRHGATRKKCSFEGCPNIVVKAGVCRRHGSKRKFCSHKE